MEQRLGTGERFFTALHQRSPVNVVRVIALEGALPPQRVWSAVQALGKIHPRLRQRVLDGRFVPSHNAPIHFRVLARSRRTHVRALIEEALALPISLASGPLFHISYVYEVGGKRAELVLAGAHAACDGVSMNALCRDLLRLCADEELEAHDEQPVLDTLLPAFPTGQRARSVARALGRCARVSVARALRETRTPAKSSAWHFAELDAPTTAELLTSARRANTTLTAALMAGSMLAAHRMHVHTSELALSVPINLRAHLPQAALDAHDLGNYTTAAFLSSRADADFWSLARALKSDLSGALADGDALAAVRDMYTCGRLLIGSGGAPLAHAMVSNSGQVDLRHAPASFEAVGFYSASSAPAVSADLSFFCNTYRGRLCLNLVYAPEVVSHARADAALATVRNLLRHACDAREDAPIHREQLARSQAR